jgi:hypothetical protein
MTDIPDEITDVMDRINNHIARIKNELNDKDMLIAAVRSDVKTMLDTYDPERKTTDEKCFLEKHLSALCRDKRVSLERAKQRMTDLKQEIELTFRQSNDH